MLRALLLCAARLLLCVCARCGVPSSSSAGWLLLGTNPILRRYRWFSTTMTTTSLPALAACPTAKVRCLVERDRGAQHFSRCFLGAMLSFSLSHAMYAVLFLRRDGSGSVARYRGRFDRDLFPSTDTASPQPHPDFATQKRNAELAPHL